MENEQKQNEQNQTQTMQNKMNIGIGNKEPEKLGPSEVEILEPKIATVQVNNKQSEIVECMVKHPSKEDLIKISQVRFVKNSKIEQSGLWFNEDEDRLIAKNSALAILLRHLNVLNVSGLIGKKVYAEQGKEGYLVFKAY